MSSLPFSSPFPSSLIPSAQLTCPPTDLPRLHSSSPPGLHAGYPSDSAADATAPTTPTTQTNSAIRPTGPESRCTTSTATSATRSKLYRAPRTSTLSCLWTRRCLLKVQRPNRTARPCWLRPASGGGLYHLAFPHSSPVSTNSIRRQGIQRRQLIQ